MTDTDRRDEIAEAGEHGRHVVRWNSFDNSSSHELDVDRQRLGIDRIFGRPNG